MPVQRIFFVQLLKLLSSVKKILEIFISTLLLKTAKCISRNVIGYELANTAYTIRKKAASNFERIKRIGIHFLSRANEYECNFRRVALLYFRKYRSNFNAKTPSIKAR